MTGDALRICVLTSVRDEAPNLLDWLAHHKAAGVDDFLVFSNDCSDGTDQMLDLLAEAGHVCHIRNVVPDGKTPQWAALKTAADHPLIKGADWIAHIDVDEFINLRPSFARLQDLIAHIDADAIVLPWRLFGHSGHATRPDLPTPAAYTRAIAQDALFPPLARFFKTLYRREGPFQKPGVHRPKQRQGTAPRWVDGSGNALPLDFATHPSRILLWGASLANDLVQLNHYSVRSAEDFIAKRLRGLPNHTEKRVDLTYWVERNFNTVRDHSISHMTPQTQAVLAELRRIPTLAEVETAGQAFHRAAFAQALKDPQIVKLYGRLLLAANSFVPNHATAQKLVALFQAANAEDTGD